MTAARNTCRPLIMPNCIITYIYPQVSSAIPWVRYTGPRGIFTRQTYTDSSTRKITVSPQYGVLTSGSSTTFIHIDIDGTTVCLKQPILHLTFHFRGHNPPAGNTDHTISIPRVYSGSLDLYIHRPTNGNLPTLIQNSRCILLYLILFRLYGIPFSITGTGHFQGTVNCQLWIRSTIIYANGRHTFWRHFLYHCISVN